MDLVAARAYKIAAGQLPADLGDIPVTANPPTEPPANWFEDFGGPNGTHLSFCSCGTQYLGGHHRLKCKVCGTMGDREWNNISKKQRQHAVDQAMKQYRRDIAPLIHDFDT